MATKKAASKTQSIKAKAGKSTKGTEFEPAHESLLALAANLVEVNEPRPYKSRYPIPDSEYQKLKAAAGKTKIAKKGALAKTAFWSGHDAKDSNDRIGYDKKTGAVFYDNDGNGAHAAIQVATLTKNLKMTAADFFVI